MIAAAMIFAMMIIGLTVNPAVSFSLAKLSSFHGVSVHIERRILCRRGTVDIAMRKQKASDRRTRRMQRGGDNAAQEIINESLQRTITNSPMGVADWKYKSRGNFPQPPRAKTGGRGRSRKRSNLYNSLSSYHNKFLGLLTAEYQAEVSYKFSRSKAWFVSDDAFMTFLFAETMTH